MSWTPAIDNRDNEVIKISRAHCGPCPHRSQCTRAQHYAEQAARAQHEAVRARRQYEAVDPDHRLVAAELEHHWELALQAVEDAREAAERFKRQSPPGLSPQMQAQLRDLGRTLPDLWRKGQLKPEQKKELVRSLMRRVVIRRPLADIVGPQWCE